MADTRNIVTTVSVAIAVLCAGWAIYATRHADRPGAMGPMGPVGAAGPGAPQGSSARNAPAGMPGRPGDGAGGMARSAPTNVVSVEVREEELSRELKAIGTARANEAVDVTSKSSNLVKAVRFSDGQRIQRGTVMVELDSAQARADLAAATAALTESTSLYNRSRELLQTQAVSKSQFEQIEATKKANEARMDAARAKLEDTVIRAPFTGRVGLRRVSVGSLINPGTIITTLDDTSVMKVDFAVPENNLSALRPGLAVTVESSAYPDRRFQGRVSSIDSRIDANTRSVMVRAALPNDDALLKPGMFLNVLLVRDQRRALVVPEEALVPEQTRQFVFVVTADKVAKREVQIGARRPGSVEIVAGLTSGERVVIEGTQKIREGATVRDLAAVEPPAASATRPRSLSQVPSGTAGR